LEPGGTLALIVHTVDGVARPARLFGDQVEDFAGEVRRVLTSRSPEGIFWDWPGDTEVTLARKPGRTGCEGRRS
jgi:hypothetical protein